MYQRYKVEPVKHTTLHESMAQVREAEGDYLSVYSHYHDAMKEAYQSGNRNEGERLRKLALEAYQNYADERGLEDA